MMLAKQERVMACNMCWGETEPVLFTVERKKLELPDQEPKMLYELSAAKPEGTCHICLGCLVALQLVPDERIEELVREAGLDIDALLKKLLIDRSSSTSVEAVPAEDC